MLHDLSLAILTGGHTSDTQPDERWRLEFLLASLSRSFSSVVLAGRRAGAYADLGLPVAPPAGPRDNSLAALGAALDAVPTPWLFCVSVDLPLLMPEVARVLHAHTSDYPGIQVVIPRLAEGLQPMAALYAASCSPAITCALGAGDTSILRALVDLRLSLVSESSFNHHDEGGACEFFRSASSREELQRLGTRLRRCPA